MDWTKAKSILIIALLITDLMLAGMFYLQHTQRSASFDSTEIENTIEVLQNRNIFVDVEIPERVPKMSVLFVKYEETDEDRLQEVLDSQIASANFRLTEDSAKELCDKIIQECNFDLPTLTYDSCTIEGDRGEVIYKNIYENIPIEESGLRCTIEGGKVTNVDRLLLSPVGYGKRKQKVIKPTDALIQFMSEWTRQNEKDKDNTVPDEVHIEKIDMVYWLDTSLGPSVGIEDTALPAWRIKYNDGMVTFVEAYDQR